ncbi:hypothetical protein LI90_4357 (plasmid) [Carbonactinospora thermoautotrophica]|uniref:Uncharacterized protein n=1 Tax=Carbonactinospora thermoautotrophica TaxID=1469144 RepID=A0A132MHZ3_9ACTN|nr:hypothetical protein [Carbonactinospora thermoautotrophica]KWW97385.1 hypothetical protein LI90_4357 [Carbonactinospora thermoautotrophica]
MEAFRETAGWLLMCLVTAALAWPWSRVERWIVRRSRRDGREVRA